MRADRPDRPLSRPRYPGRLTAAAIVVLAVLALAPAASADLLTPKSGGSPNANEIHSLYKLVLYVAIVVFVVVEGALLYSVIKFRARRGAVAAQIHGNTRLEIGWTVGAAAILVVLTVITFVKLPSIVNPPASDPGVVLSASTTNPSVPQGKSLTVCVTGRQYLWRYTYGPNCDKAAFSKKLPYSYQEMVVPAGETVILVVQSTDVIHAWWVPSLGGKVDAVPGYTQYTWFKSPHPALYHGQCAQLCGRQHAFMTALVHVVTPAEYRAWIGRQQALIDAQNAQVVQLRQQLTASGNL